MSNFVKCGNDVVVDKNEDSSWEWIRTDSWRGGDPLLVIHMKNGINHSIKHQPHYVYDGVDCYKIEKELMK